LKVNLIVAASENNVIGVKNDLPWNLPKDMNFFKTKTSGHCVIMGRKNYLSIPEKFRPLPNRTNIILTKNTNFKAEKCEIFNSLEKALNYCKEIGDENPFIIGGGQLYKFAIENKIVDIIYLTRIHANIDGDTFFPKLNLNEWEIISEKFNKKDSRHKFDYTFLKFIKKS
jgi:dihydrofolate reductase